MIRQYTLMLLMLLTALATSVRAQQMDPMEDPDGLEDFDFAEKAVWTFSGGGIVADVIHSHDALQHRADYNDDNKNAWEDGDTKGDGVGFQLMVAKDYEGVQFSMLQSEFKWENNQDYSWQTVDSDRTEMDFAYYRAIAGSLDEGANGIYGWTLGVRTIDTDKHMTIWERGKTIEHDGSIKWKLVRGGYFGIWQPMGWRIKAFGNVNFLFGEVDGLSRRGNDTRADGLFSERYENNSSLAYGINGAGGVGIDLPWHLNVTAGFQAEWLYSFDATDSGTVVFPDNDDALFIENTRLLYASINLVF